MTETVSAVPGAAVAAPIDHLSAPPPSVSEPSNELGKDAFLKLLVAQLKHQDPLAPTGSDEFIATSAQFTVVEKLDELTKQGANSALISSISTASALIGREITAISGDGTITATVTKTQVVGGEVSLVTDRGAISIDQIVPVGAVGADTPADTQPGTQPDAGDDTTSVPPTRSTDQDENPTGEQR